VLPKQLNQQLFFNQTASNVKCDNGSKNATCFALKGDSHLPYFQGTNTIFNWEGLHAVGENHGPKVLDCLYFFIPKNNKSQFQAVLKNVSGFSVGDTDKTGGAFQVRSVIAKIPEILKKK